MVKKMSYKITYKTIDGKVQHFPHILSFLQSIYPIVKHEQNTTREKVFDYFYIKLNTAIKADRYVTITLINNKTIDKINTSVHKILSFTNKELEFFDRLGLELTSFQIKTTGQDITDWYGK